MILDYIINGFLEWIPPYTHLRKMRWFVSTGGRRRIFIGFNFLVCFHHGRKHPFPPSEVIGLGCRFHWSAAAAAHKDLVVLDRNYYLKCMKGGGKYDDRHQSSPNRTKSKRTALALEEKFSLSVWIACIPLPSCSVGYGKVVPVLLTNIGRTAFSPEVLVCIDQDRMGSDIRFYVRPVHTKNVYPLIPWNIISYSVQYQVAVRSEITLAHHLSSVHPPCRVGSYSSWNDKELILGSILLTFTSKPLECSFLYGYHYDNMHCNTDCTYSGVPVSEHEIVPKHIYIY